MSYEPFIVAFRGPGRLAAAFDHLAAALRNGAELVHLFRAGCRRLERAVREKRRKAQRMRRLTGKRR